MSNIESNNQNRTAWSEAPWFVIEASGGGYYIANTENGAPGSFIVGPEQGTLTIDDATRIVECVNSLIGIIEPAAFIEKAKIALQEKKDRVKVENLHPNRQLQPGDLATTDYIANKTTQVTILERKTGQQSSTGIMYRVTPALCCGDENVWFDADWFKPV